MADESFKKEFLDTHNAYRAQHGAPPLTFNTELDDAAQKWANQMLAKKKLGHSNTNDGENVFYAWSSETKKPTVVVGQYRPAGNITNAGYYQKNVLPKGTE
ncbi:Golgi-associated plant pathogenesis-related protein 1-like [Neolamprologus brichardi]|uniref:Golgi-associated plant pathogenesis-related protein 1-like n=1 Tax=Neolamprologus brichardi TaxID=32507 RepID=UPI001643D194|nr:Golgi-associated plant pathogenesis-related protein 1-like [Neolamprologus brichardi]